MEEIFNLFNGIDKFFDLGTSFSFPTYDDELTLRINAFVNRQGYRPFLIESVKEQDDTLSVKGHFETFDGLEVRVVFEGIYGDPNHFEYHGPLDANDSFVEFDLRAELVLANARQKEIFSALLLNQGQFFRFNEDTLHYSKKSNHDEYSRAGLRRIDSIGKFVRFYDELHTEFVLNVFQSRVREFEAILRRFEICDYDLSFELSELRPDNEESEKPPELLADFVLYATCDVGRSFMINEGTGLIDKTTSKELVISELFPTTPAHAYAHKSVIEYTFEYNLDEFDPDFVKKLGLKNPSVVVEWEFVRRAAKLVEKHGTKQDPRLDVFDFIWTLCGFFMDVNLSTFTLEKSQTDELVYQARMDVKKQNPDYVPLYLTLAESPLMNDNIYSKNRGNLNFPLEQYKLFRDLIFTYLIDCVDSVDDFVAHPSVQTIVSKDIAVRLKELHECYLQDPINYEYHFLNRDPAYVKALELKKEQEQQNGQNLSGLGLDTFSLKQS